MHFRRLMGQDLDSCSLEELKEITIQIEKSLTIVRSRKVNLINEYIVLDFEIFTCLSNVFSNNGLIIRVF